MPHVQLKTPVPGPKGRAVMARLHEHTPRSVAHVTPIVVERASGALVTDVDGNTFIDFAGGIGALNGGHTEPSVVRAVREQAERFLHTCFMVLAYEPYVDLAARLNALSPGRFAKKTLLFNSGSEAIENAAKIARGATGRTALIAFDRAFHGRTVMALSLTGQVTPYKRGFGPFVPEVYRVPYPYPYRCPVGRADCACDLACVRPLEDLFRSDVPPERVAAIIAEPVLGEGGFVIPPASFFRHLREVCDRHGILLIADEVQTGFGRTGKMFAVEHSGVAPDLMVMAKSLSGGTPLGAVTGRADIMDALAPGSLGGTYGGNPLACRAALAAIDVIEKQGLVERAVAIGARILERFEALRLRHPLVGDVRGVGAMCAMELVRDRATREPATEQTAALVRACYERGLIIMKSGAGGNVVRTLMPLVIRDDELDEGLAILEQALANT